MADAFQGIIFALQRHDDAISGDEGVQGEQAERRRAIDQHMIVGRCLPADRVGEPVFPARRLDQLDLGAGQVHRGRREKELRHLGLDDDLRQPGLADDQVVAVRLVRARREAQPGRRVGLRVEIQQQHPQAAGGERRAEIDRGGCLADAALLVGDRQNPGRAARCAAEAPARLFLSLRSIFPYGVRF